MASLTWNFPDRRGLGETFRTETSGSSPWIRTMIRGFGSSSAFGAARTFANLLSLSTGNSVCISTKARYPI